MTFVDYGHINTVNQLFDVGENNSCVELDPLPYETMNRKRIYRKPYQRGCRGGRNKIRYIHTKISSWAEYPAKLNRRHCDVNSGVHHDLLVNIPKGDYAFSDKQFLKLAVVNTCSLRNKYVDFLQHCSEQCYDVCFVNETWLKPADKKVISGLKQDGFNFINVPRKLRTGGGIGVLFKKSLKVKILDSSELSSFEYVIYHVSTGSDSIRCVCVYRPPYSSAHPVTCATFVDEFTDFMNSVLADHQDVVFFGDFNIPMNQVDNSDTKAFTDILHSFALHQHVCIPTHVMGNTIDLIISQCASKLKFSVPTTDYFISDHSFISTVVSINKAKVERKTIQCRNMKNIDHNLFANDLQICCDQLLHADCIDMDLFNSQLAAVMEKHAPVVRKRISARHKTPWYDDVALDMKHEKRRLEKIWKRSRERTDLVNFRSCVQKYREHLAKAQDKFIEECIHDCGTNQAKLYRAIFRLLDLQKENPLPEGSSDESLAEKFAEFFASKIQKIRDELSVFENYDPVGECACHFEGFSPVSETAVHRVVLGSKSATCISDPIPTLLLKQHITVLLPALTKIINNSLLSGVFYKQWKTAIVKPLIKKKGLQCIEQNYRPVSNLTFTSKITEKCALSQFMPYLESNSLLPSYQSAYRRHFSTETVLLYMFDNILWSMERQNVTSLVAIDLSAAFDTVDHEILMNVLTSKFGVRNTAYAWFHSYLSHRSTQVQINNALSNPRELHYSVPQGSVAGPVLFSAYASTIPDAIQDSSVKLSGYADDHGLLRSFDANDTEAEEINLAILEQTMCSIKHWMDQNKLKMNSSKTEFLYIGSKQQLQKCNMDFINVAGTDVHRSHCVKYLGVLMDENLQLHEHITAKCKVAALNIQYISSIRKHISLESAKQLCYSLVLSHLDYCNVLFIGLPECNTAKMQKVQNWAARVVLKRTRYDSSHQCLFDLHWLPIKYRVEFKILLFVYKALNGCAPDYVSQLLSPAQSSRVTRSTSSPATSLHMPFITRKTFAARSFSVMGPTLWNSLPTHIRLSNSITAFRSQIKTFLFRKAFKDFY